MKIEIKNIDEFLQKLGEIDLLTAEEELVLLKTVHEKGADCDEMEKLCWTNMRFVVSLSSQYQNRGLKLTELIPIGVEGLEKAALEYEIGSQQKFMQYAVPVMRQCLEEAIAMKEIK